MELLCSKNISAYQLAIFYFSFKTQYPSRKKTQEKENGCPSNCWACYEYKKGGHRSHSIVLIARNQWRLKTKPQHISLHIYTKVILPCFTITFQWRVPTQVSFHTGTRICSKPQSASSTNLDSELESIMYKTTLIYIHTREGGKQDQSSSKQPRNFSGKNAPRYQNISASDQNSMQGQKCIETWNPYTQNPQFVPLVYLQLLSHEPEHPLLLPRDASLDGNQG